jgi:hypothetical protein
MTILGNGLITMANGFIAMVSGLASIESLCILLLLASLGWMAQLEVDEFNRQGTKPQIRRH